MKQQIMIIGLGQFGMSLAESLADRGAEILAADIDQARVETAAKFADNAVALDATDEAELERLRPDAWNTVVCAMGNSSQEAAIICTALLRQLGCRHIVARACSPTYSRILTLVGAHEVINPELDFGKRFASHLLYRRLFAGAPPEQELELNELRLPDAMAGKSLAELALPRRFHIIVAAIRRDHRLVRPQPDEPLLTNDMLLVVSDQNALAKLAESYS